MGRPPSNGAPSFRFYPIEVAQMEAILQKYEGHVPPRDLIDALAQRFSQSPERAGKIVVQMKQIWNWFQNRRYALRAKLGKSVGKPTTSPVTRDEFTQMRNVLHAPQPMAVFSGPHLVRNTSEAPFMEFEARSSRDGAWYDVHEFLSHRYLETGNPEVLVRFSGFGPDEDEWLNIRKHVRQRSLPCEALECIAVLPGDLILCFQEGKEQALYYDAHVLDAQRRRHDLRGCRCRFLVRFDHDQSEEIIPLRKICRRPETDYRLQQLHAANETAASTSIPVIDLTNSSPLGLTNSNPITSPIKVSSSPIMGCGPSVQASSSIGPPTSVLTPAVVATSSVPGTSAVTEIDSNKIDDLSPARIPDPEENKVDEENPAQIPAQVTESSKSETDNPVLVPELNKIETNGSGPVPVHEQFRVEKNIPTPLLEHNKTGNSRQENVSQTTISVPGREKAECSTGPTEEMVE